MTDTEIRIAKRVSTYMLEIAEQQIDLNFFQGLGMSLAIIYEECTLRTAADKRPKELIQWAKDLPSVSFPHAGSI